MALTRIKKDNIRSTEFGAFTNTRKNAVINGNFDVWQRGTSFSTFAGEYTADRWFADGATVTGTITQQAFTLGQTNVPNEPTYFLRYDATTAGTGQALGQRIESVRTFAGKTINVSFYAKAASGFSPTAINIIQNFGTGGSPSTAVTTEVVATPSITTSWQKFTYSVAVPSISTKTLGSNGDDYLELNFDLSDAIITFDIAQVQVEEGNVATDYEMKSVGEEFRDCQRYYQVNDVQQYAYPNADTATSRLINIQYYVVMRGAATVTITTPTNWSTGPTATDGSIYGVQINGTGAATTTAVYCEGWTADAEL